MTTRITATLAAAALALGALVAVPAAASAATSGQPYDAAGICQNVPVRTYYEPYNKGIRTVTKRDRNGCATEIRVR